MAFKKIAIDAIKQVNAYKVELAKLLLLPFLLLLYLDLLSDYLTETYLNFLIAIPYSIGQTIVAITTHRMILLGVDSVKIQDIFRWSKRETFFLLYFLGIFGVPLLIIFYPFALLGFMGIFISSILMIWITSRFSLVFPAIALGKEISLEGSWELTRENQFLMVLTIWFFPMLLDLPAIFLTSLPHTAWLTSLLSIMATVITVAALSLTYQFINQDKLNTTAKDIV